MGKNALLYLPISYLRVLNTGDARLVQNQLAFIVLIHDFHDPHSGATTHHVDWGEGFKGYEAAPQLSCCDRCVKYYTQ